MELPRQAESPPKTHWGVRTNTNSPSLEAKNKKNSSSKPTPKLGHEPHKKTANFSRQFRVIPINQTLAKNMAKQNKNIFLQKQNKTLIVKLHNNAIILLSSSQPHTKLTKSKERTLTRIAKRVELIDICKRRTKGQIKIKDPIPQTHSEKGTHQ